MKKLFKITMGLLLLMAPMTMSAQTVDEVRQTLAQYCLEKNQDTPIKDGDDDAYYVHFDFDQDQMNIVYGVGTEIFAALCADKEKALEAVVETLATDEELLGVVALLTLCDGTMAFVICDYNGDVSDSDNQLIMAFDEDDLKTIIARISE